jgi:carbamoyltransferase
MLAVKPSPRLGEPCWSGQQHWPPGYGPYELRAPAAVQLMRCRSWANETRRLVLYRHGSIITPMKSSPVYVIGTGLSHDSSVCLLADGKVVLGIEKERLTRRKHDSGNDSVAMQYVLDKAGITLGDVALVVQNENFGMFRKGNSEYRKEPRLLTDATRVVTISHHLAHAYSAFGPSGFDQASVLVIDGCGNAYEDCIDLLPGTLLEKVGSGIEHIYFEKDSYYTSRDGVLHAVAKDFSCWGAREWLVNPPTTLHSIGGVYEAFSQYVFSDFSDSGKLMGLAPYGKPGRFGLSLFDLCDGQVLVRRDTLREFTFPAKSRSALNADFEYYADVAHWVQMEIERALLYVVRDRYERCPSRNLAYAGGVALNAVANSRILRETGFENLYIQPAAGDNGLAIGCAYYGWLEVLGQERVHGGASTYLGAPKRTSTWWCGSPNCWPRARSWPGTVAVPNSAPEPWGTAASSRTRESRAFGTTSTPTSSSARTSGHSRRRSSRMRRNGSSIARVTTALT